MRQPIVITPEILSLTKLTYEEVIKDKVITEYEMEYLTKLHNVIFGVWETDQQTIINELSEYSTWKIKIK